MLAIQVNLIGIVIALIFSYILYQKGHKRLAIELRNGVYGFIICYPLLVLLIGG